MNPSFRLKGIISMPTVLSLLVTVIIAYNSINNFELYSYEIDNNKGVSNNNIIVTKDTKYWTTSRNPHKKNLPPGIRISFQVRNTGEYHIKTDESCYKNPEDSQRGWNRTSKLPPTLIDTWTANDWANRTNQTITYNDEYGRILDFSTSVATDLKILFLGDSVGVQMAEGFDSAASGIPTGSALSYAKEMDGVNDTYLSSLPPNPRHQIESFMKTRACTFSSGPIRGGGGIGLWRVVKLISMSRMGGAVCNSHQGGWSKEQLQKILELKYSYHNEEGNIEGNETSIGKFDAVVLRIQLGWMAPKAITIEGIEESIRLCNTLIGATAVVIMTINFTNDVHNRGEWEWATKMNDKIRILAKTLNEEYALKNFRVIIMEFSDFTTQVHWENARTIPDASGHSFEYQNLVPSNMWKQVANDWRNGSEVEFLFDRFKPWHAYNKHPHSIPTVCTKMNPIYTDDKGVERRSCIRNAIMRDGLHWCMSSIGPRYHAGLSCLLGCAYNSAYRDNNVTTLGVELCEQTCNDQFMTLVPIHETWLDTNTTIFAVP